MLLVYGRANPGNKLDRQYEPKIRSISTSRTKQVHMLIA